MHKVLFLGDSVMRGEKSTGGPNFDVSSAVEFWNNPTNAGSGNGSAFITPERGSAPFASDGDNNSAPFFCQTLNERTLEGVSAVLFAKDGSTIVDHDVGGSLHAGLRSVYTASGLGAADIVVMDLGHNDAGDGMSGTTYKTHLDSLIAALEADSIADQDTLYIMHGLFLAPTQTNHGVIDTAIQEYCSVRANCAYVPVTGLAAAQGSHFTGNSQAQLGRARDWLAYRNLANITGANDYFAANESAANNDDSGDFDAGSWQKRKQNRVQADCIDFHLIDGDIAVPPGRWDISTIAMAFHCGRHQTRVRDVISGDSLFPGVDGYVNPSAGGLMNSVSAAMGLVDAQTFMTIRLEHYCDTSKERNGLGVSNPVGNGERAIFSKFIARKI